jgi:hypothetical protein
VTTRVQIDLNVRVRGNQTFAGFEDVEPREAVSEDLIGAHVIAYEPESGVSGDGRVTEIDPASRLVYLDVDWRSLRDDGPANASLRSVQSRTR